MPVPLPTTDTINLQPPDAAEAQIMADGIASAVTGRSGLLPMQRALIEALFPAMTGHVVTVHDPPATSAAALAAALARRDLAFRSRGVQIMLLCALVTHPIEDAVAENIARFACELGVEEGMVDVARDFAAGSLDLAVHDFTRNGYEGIWNEEESAAAVHSSAVLHDAWAFSEADPALAARWAALEHLAPDTIGRKVWEMYRARGFTFPGTPGSAPPLLAQHDWVHVLADYGTTVESEVEVFGFIARANDDLHAFSLLAMVLSLFETGYLASGAGLFEASPGHFSSSPHMAERLSDAMRRGALCHDDETGADSIDFLRMDWFAVADIPCAQLRRRFCLAPKAESALAAGSVGPWEPGGISPFQVKAGRAMAGEIGIPYDAHGARP
ncbi:MAG TPA: hypothetical protein VHD39_05395 [Acidimicrobiales bacterium]|nr:hypothetical protein [Acidimicrobiales bacterium]